jgi:hypothetical protein
VARAAAAAAAAATAGGVLKGFGNRSINSSGAVAVVTAAVGLASPLMASTASADPHSFVGETGADAGSGGGGGGECFPRVD